jgi:hypothetical protein
MKSKELEARDLRYGNLVERNGVVWEVNDIIGASGLVIMLPKEGYDSLGKRAVQEFKPIPLNKGWLVKMEAVIIGGNESHAGYKINELIIMVYKDCIRIDLGQFEIDVKYVHQLQNLYYDLTGTELTINNHV